MSRSNPEPSQMCIFSRPIEAVWNTCIFARLNPEGRQYLAYSMSASLPEEMAMVLPLPVASGQTIEFLDLSGCPHLFAHFKRSFQMQSRSQSRDVLSLSLELLPVVDVGAFQASFVPGLADFNRLDPRFRLDSSVWQKLPQYQDFGFAVFQLRDGEREFHPMGLSFPSRHPDRVFFPTVHVHDGDVPEEEEFDHSLYLQSSVAPEGWHPSLQSLGAHIPWQEDTVGLLDRSQLGFRRELKGKLPNRDVIVQVGPVDDPKRHNVARPQQSSGETLRPGLTRKQF